MVTQNEDLFDNCHYLHHDPIRGRSFIDKHRDDGFRVLARMISISGPSEDGESQRRPIGAAQAVSVTFEVVGADWAMGWLSLSRQDWISDVMGKPIDSSFSLRNAPLGRFTYHPSDAPWDMMLLRTSLGSNLDTPDDALRSVQQGTIPRWFQTRVNFDFAPSSLYCPVNFFASIFDDALPAKVDAVQALSEEFLVPVRARFRMPDILKQSAQKTSELLTGLGLKADSLAVYDVGQGAAQALVRLDESKVTPELYVDMGCGRNHQKDSALPDLKFCTSMSPPVILSHGDEDHWCGAVTKAMANAGYPAHKLKWIAPATSGSMSFMSFASSIWKKNGSVHTLDLTNAKDSTVTAATSTGNLLITKGTSRQFNHSGLIVAAVNKDNRHYWLLPGDCDYHYFPTTLKSMATTPLCVALTAFHHGAKPESQATVPLPLVVGDGYHRLVYSFGCANDHKHPTHSAATMHQDAGWLQGFAWLKAPGEAPPLEGSNARATAWTPPTPAPPPYMHAGGVLIGWSAAPVLPTKAVCCDAAHCKAAVPQQV